MMPSPDLTLVLPCLSCDDPILPEEQTHEIGCYVDGIVTMRRVHVECMLRDVLGGIGHHEDHEFWCNQMGDPDGGRTRRESAILVWAKFQRGDIEPGS